MTRTLLFASTVTVLCAAVVCAEETKEPTPHWTFTEEQLRLFNPPKDADAEKMLQWTRSLERPIPRDIEPYGGYDKYREHVQLMRIMACRAILATDPPLELEQTAWRTLWFPYFLLCKQNPDEWLSKMKAVFNELTELTRKKGEVLDEQTVLYLSTRGEILSNGDFVSDIVKRDKDFLVYGDELLADVSRFLEKYHLFGNLKRELYRIKSSVYQGMSAVDEKYEQMLTDFNAKMRELVIQNEDSLKSPWWYELLLPEEPFDCPEKQAEAYRLIEKFQKVLDATDGTNRFDPKYEPDDGIGWLYRFQAELFESLIEADRTHLPQLQAYLEALEKKNDPLAEMARHIGYDTVWHAKLFDFAQEDGTDDDLEQMFEAIAKLLDVSDENYAMVGYNLSLIISHYTPFEKPQRQQELFKTRLEQVIAKMEVQEKAWKDAGRGMLRESYVELFQNYLDFLRMPGTVITFTGNTVDGKAFDLESQRGKVVLLNFWATWCGPCIAEIPELQELYEKYHVLGFEIVAISIDAKEDTAKLVEFVRSRQLPWIQLHDAKRELHNKLYGKGVPHCLLLDRDGRVILQEALGERLQQKLAEVF